MHLVGGWARLRGEDEEVVWGEGETDGALNQINPTTELY
jgi:hypothetical protein